MAVYLQSTTEENLYHCILNSAWGSKTNSLSHWQQGDTLIVYVERALAALFNIIGDSYWDDSPVWPNELYPYRAGIELQKIIHPAERYSISNMDVRETLYKHHSTAYGITLVLTKKSLHPDAVDVLMAHIDAVPEWRNFDVEYELGLLVEQKEGQESEIAKEVVQARSETHEDEEASVHTQMQYYLAQLGQSLGFHIWIPKPDQGRSFKGIQLGELSVPELPRLPFSDDVVRIVQYIDVIWLQYQNPTHLFEVEYSTSIYSGLLRMSDFAALIPSLNVQMYICATDEKRNKVRTEVNRPTFDRMPVPLTSRCRFISIEQLDSFVESQHDYLRHFNTSILDELSESLATSSA